MKKKNYAAAFKLSSSLLSKSEPDIVCGRTGARISNESYYVSYFNREYEIQPRGMVFRPSGLSQSEQILILHYLINDGNKRTKGEFVHFKDLPNGMFYNYAYRKRGPDRIVKRFKSNPEELIAVSENIGGKRFTWGDVSVAFHVFPEIEVYVVLYEADEEFPADAEIFFKDDIINHLDLEDIAVMAGIIANKLTLI